MSACRGGSIAAIRSTFTADIGAKCGQHSTLNGTTQGTITIIVEGVDIRRPVIGKTSFGMDADTIRDAIEFILPETKRIKELRRD